MGHISVTRYDLCYLGSLPVNENTAKWIERRWKDEYMGAFTVSAVSGRVDGLLIRCHNSEIRMSV